MKGPHREQRYRELCAGDVDEPCRRPASVACLRCGAPLCDRHIPPVDRRCAGCEAHYEIAGPNRAALLRAEGRILSGAAVAVGVGIGFASGLGAFAVAGFTAAIFAGTHWFRMLAHLSHPERPGLAAWLERRHRRRFLRQRNAQSERIRAALEA